MFLLSLIAIAGCWCARRHWMRLDDGKGAWAERFWPWVLQGMVFPSLVWAVVNLGLSDRFPALIPQIVLAQSAKQPWVSLWLAGWLFGTVLILAHWAAVTHGWLLGIIAARAPDKAEFGFNLAVFGALGGLAAAGFVHGTSLVYLAGGLVIVLLPAVHFTLDFAEQPLRRPTYDRAIARIKRGKYNAAEWEVIAQLEKADSDFDGWIMLAELYARQFKNLEDAARVVLDICNSPETQPVQISLACHKLADWQMEIGENPDAARASLELLCRKLPGSHFAKMAELRIRQIPRTVEDLRQSRLPRKIQLPALREDLETGESSRRLPVKEAKAQADRLVAVLNEDPNDISAREKLAAVLAVELEKPGLGIEQLRLLIEMPETPDEQKAKWLSQIAAWEWNLKKDREGFRSVLKEIIRQFPNSSEAFAAQRRLFLLETGAKFLN